MTQEEIIRFDERLKIVAEYSKRAYQKSDGQITIPQDYYNRLLREVLLCGTLILEKGMQQV